MLSRVSIASEAAQNPRASSPGRRHIVIGTHRLISGDVVFKDSMAWCDRRRTALRVLHQRKIQGLFKLVDSVTLSATPIPRTLYLSLVGVKDMSTIETPRSTYLPVETIVCG